MSKIDAILRDFISSIFAVSFIFAKNMNRFQKKKPFSFSISVGNEVVKPRT